MAVGIHVANLDENEEDQGDEEEERGQKGEDAASSGCLFEEIGIGESVRGCGIFGHDERRPGPLTTLPRACSGVVR